MLQVSVAWKLQGRDVGALDTGEGRWPMMKRIISLSQQIEEVKRELDMRARVYPNLVRKGAMRQGEAELHMERMQAVLDTLYGLQQIQDSGELSGDDPDFSEVR